MKHKTRIAAVATLGATALALSACAGGASSAGASVWALTGGVHETMWKQSFASWNAANPDESFAVDWIANDPYKEKIRTAIGAGTAPTLVFSWAGGPMREYIASDKIVDLTGQVDDLLDRVIPSVAAAGIVDGKVYAVPNSQSQPEFIYYNVDLFEQVGVEVPTTWDEMMDVVAAFRAEGIAPFSLAGASKWPELLWLQYVTDRVGGEQVFESIMNGEQDAWSDPAILESLTRIQDLVKAGGFTDGFGSISADANADAALIHTGQAAMLLQGSWVFGTFKNDAPEFVADGKLGFATFPTIAGGTGDPRNIVGNPANYWSVSADATPEAQRTAIEYLNTAVFNDEYTDTLLNGGGVPPLIGIEDKLAGAENADFLTFSYNLVANAPAFTLSWDQALPPAQAQALLTNLDKVFLLSITPEEFVANMNAAK